GAAAERPQPAGRGPATRRRYDYLCPTCLQPYPVLASCRLSLLPELKKAPLERKFSSIARRMAAGGQARAPGGDKPMESGDDGRERTIIPTLRYRDVAWAIAWLSDAFGFETHTVVGGGDGSVEYAELIFGNGMIMLGPVEDPAVRSSAQPQPAGGAEIQSCYVRIDDPTAHRARAMAAGAEIVLDIEDGRSGRGYSCRDPEGHIWHFGTYEPRRRRHERASLKDKLGRVIDAGVRRRPFGIGLATTTLIAASVAAWALAVADPAPVSASAAAEQSDTLRAERELRELR